MAAQLMSQARYTDGRTLKTVLSDKAYAALVKQCQESGMPIELLNNFKPGMAVMMLTVQELTKIERFFDELIRAWREGDNEALERLFVDDMRKYPEVYQALLAKRNQEWMKELKEMLATPEVEFALVGAGHLVGPDGLLQSFEEMGCEVRMLDAKASH